MDYFTKHKVSVSYLCALILLIPVEILCQSCFETTSGSNTDYTFVRPFIPSFHDKFSFGVQAQSDAYLVISSEAYDTVDVNNTGEVYLLELGYASTSGQRSRLKRKTWSVFGAIENTITDVPHQSGLLSSFQFRPFFIQITSAGQFLVGLEDEPSPFISVFISEAFQKTKYVGVRTQGNTGTWDFCNSDGQSLQELSINKVVVVNNAIVPDGSRITDENTDNTQLTYCLTSGAQTNSWVRIDLGQVYDIGLVEIVVPSARNLVTEAGKLEGAIVHVGSCNSDLTAQNHQCGSAVTKKEPIIDKPVLRQCPMDSFGQYVYISISGVMKEIVLCEVSIYGREVADTMITSLSAMLLAVTNMIKTEADTSVWVAIHRVGDNRSCTYVDINTELSTASENEDYTVSSHSLMFNPGQILNLVALTLKNDNLHEPREQITLQLQNTIGANVLDREVTMTILDDDDLFGFEATTFTIDENSGSQEIIINRQGELAETVSGRVTVLTGTAKGMLDFDDSIQEFIFIPNVDKSSVIITLHDDNITEGTETFSLTMELTEGHGIIDESRKVATVTIIDDESPPPTTESTVIGSCQLLQCQNGASCEEMNDTYVCICTEGYQGDDCSEHKKSSWLTTTNILIIAVVGIIIIVILVIVGVCCYKKKKSSVKRSRTISRQVLATNDYLTPMGQSNPQFELWETPTLDKMVDTERFEIQRSRIRLHEVIGTGAFGEVYLATARNIAEDRELSHVAVKVLKDSKEQTSEFKKELKFLQSLDPHPNIIGFIGCCTDKDPYYLVLEYAPDGNLREYLHSIRTESNEEALKPKDIIGFAFDVSKGMEYISSKNCVHRDLATRNILLGKSKVCKLSDFGLARDMEAKHQYEMKSDGRVPVRWLAPESIKDNKYSIKTDVWSFGIVLWELVTMGAHPYAGMNAKQVVKMVCDGERLEKPDHCNDAIYNSMLKCWDHNPKRRPDFRDIRIQLEMMKADASGYLRMESLNSGSYVYLERQKWENNTKETVY